MQHDPEIAIRFLRLLHPRGPWVLTAIELDRKGIYTETFGPDTEEQLGGFLRRHPGTNIYYSLNEPIAEDVNKKLKREAIARVSYFHVDLDPRAGGTFVADVQHTVEQLQAKYLDEERARILALLKAPIGGIPQPTGVIFSGGGYQGLWRLEEPIEIGGDLVRAEDAKRYNVQIELALGGDNCHNIDRIMRLPGSVNWPDAKKRAKGRTAQQAKVEWFSPLGAFPLSTFAQAPIIQTRATSAAGFGSALGTTSPTVPAVPGNIKRLGSVHDLPDGVRDKTKVLIVQGRDPDEHGPVDRSKVLFHVCCELLRAGCTDEVVYSVITDPDFGISASVLDKGAATERYAIRQIERAKENAVDPQLRELNERHAVVENLGGRCRVIEEVMDPAFNRTALTMQSFDDFRNRYMNRQIVIGMDAKNREIYAPLGKWWLGHASRRQFRSLMFAPGREVEGVYNMWRGFAVEPRAGDKHHKWMKHLETDICANNPVLFNYLIDWMARAVQHPDTPGEVAVVLRGRKGTGKSIFAKTFGALFGRHYWAVSDAKHIVGNFNAHLRDCVVLFGDEAFWAGDKKHESVLKTLITEETIVVERKGIDAEAASNYVHLIMASNSQWVVPASYDERRFLVLDVSADHIQDTAYFGAIRDDLDDNNREGLSNLLHELQVRDLSNFDVRHVPKTDALIDQKIHSMESLEEWWFRKLEDGVLAPSHAGWDQPIAKDLMIDDYLVYAQRLGAGKRASATGLDRFLRRVVPPAGPQQFQAMLQGKDRRGDPMIGRSQFWRFPELPLCRKQFDDACGGPFNWPAVILEGAANNQDPF